MLRLEKQWSSTYLSWLKYQQCDHTTCERPCVLMHLYTVCLHTTLVRPCVFLEDRVASVKCGWNMLLIWLSARVSRTPSPRQPTPPTLSLGHLVRRRRGFVQDEGWGSRFVLAGCETGSITSQEPCWVTTPRWRRGHMWGVHAWPSVSAVWLCVLKRTLRYRLKGALLYLTYMRSGEFPLLSAWPGWDFRECGHSCPTQFNMMHEGGGINRQLSNK